MATRKGSAARVPREPMKRELFPEIVDTPGLARIVLVRIPEHLSGQERGLPSGCTFGCGRLFFLCPSSFGRSAQRAAAVLARSAGRGFGTGATFDAWRQFRTKRITELPREVRTPTPALRVPPTATSPGEREGFKGARVRE